jgi:hypothetical protein
MMILSNIFASACSTGDAAGVWRDSTTACMSSKHTLVSITPIHRHGEQPVQREFVISSPYLSPDGPLRSIPTTLWQTLERPCLHSIGSLLTRSGHHSDLIHRYAHNQHTTSNLGAECGNTFVLRRVLHVDILAHNNMPGICSACTTARQVSQ